MKSKVCKFVFVVLPTITLVSLLILFSIYPRYTQPIGIRFDSKASRTYAMNKVSGIAARKLKETWSFANDICYNGVVFPSHILTSTFVNVTVYFHNEEEMRSVMYKMRSMSSWSGQNLQNLLERMNQLKNAAFIDIYAGLGLYSLPVAKMGHHVIAVEHRYTFAERLCRGVIAGEFKNRAIIVNNIVSHVTETSKLQPPHTRIIGANLSEESKPVTAVPLSSLLDVFPDKEVVLKIDMNRDLVKTILSSSKFFDNVKVHYILMKWAHTVSMKDTAKLVDFLKNYNLLPCLNPFCLHVLRRDQHVWPAFVWWVNEVHLPNRILFNNRHRRHVTNRRKFTTS